MARQIKSRSRFRRKKVRTPSGKTVIHYVKKKPKKVGCTRCSRKLGGIPREIPSKIKKMTRSERTVSREYGGVLCSRCVIDLERYRTRVEEGVIIKRDLTIERFLPLGWYLEVSKEVKPQEEVKEKEKKKAKKKEKKEEKPKKEETKKKAAKKETKTKKKAEKPKKEKKEANN